MNRLVLPVGLERPVVASGALVWAGVVAGTEYGLWAIVGLMIGGIAVWIARRRWTWIVAIALLGVAAGWAGSSRLDLTSEFGELAGRSQIRATVVGDGRVDRFDGWALVRPSEIRADEGWHPWRGPVGLVTHVGAPAWTVGDRIELDGRVEGRAGSAAGDRYTWRMRPTDVKALGRDAGALLEAADWIRRRIGSSVDEVSDRSAAALVTGFLIGDIRELSTTDRLAMRDAGLSHFVAVSGSNVALFLVVWWLILAPIAHLPFLRAVGGLLGLMLFTLVTRWEPSVVRAATMAGLVIVGRLVRIPVTVWNALGAGTVVLLVVSPELATDVGFQLSVAATAGVVAGSRMFEGSLPRWIAAPLGVTVAAQLAVAPILLTVFGSLPLWSPVANLLAGPLVIASTVAGGVGAFTGLGAAIDLAVWLATFVLAIAHAVSGLPSVGWVGLVAVLAVAALLVWSRRLRPLGIVVVAAVMAISVVPKPELGGPAVAFLDVGQGDAILLEGAAGGTVLVDGGPDPAALTAALARHGVRSIDLVVLTHPDEDHIGGLIDVVGRMPIGRLWHSDPVGAGPRLAELLAIATARGIGVDVPAPATIARVGGIELEVLGPLRRYASVNDQGLVVMATVGGTRIFLTADIEAIPQGEIGMPSADIIKLPHHGSRTTDLDWLATTDARLAVITVGENTFGHPSAEILGVLDELGIAVRRTDQHGDVVVRLGDPTMDPSG